MDPTSISNRVVAGLRSSLNRRVRSGPEPSCRVGNMSPSTTILPCPNCRRRLRVPTDRGDLTLTCPTCRWRWDWSPRQDEVFYIGDDARDVCDPRLARALDIFEEFERQWAESRAEDRRAGDLWDEWLDGPRGG
jgi:hypothetical protein